MKKLLLLFLLFGLDACTDSKKELTENTFEHQEIQIIDPWARPSSSGSNTAAYMFIENGTTNADTLLNAYADISDDVQIHESYSAEDGMMGMRRIQNVVLESGDYAQLKPGGIHIMFLGLNKDLSIGDSISVELEFAVKGRISIQAPVRSPS